MQFFKCEIASLICNLVKIGSINLEGKELTPILYDDIYPFRAGTAKIMLGGKWGIIDKEGREIWDK